MTRLRWPRRVRLLAALLTVIAGLAYPVRELSILPGGAQAVHASSYDAMPPESPSGHTHESHCLFCLTGAFSTAPEAALHVGLLPERPGRELSPTPRTAQTDSTHADARAPPLAPA